MMMIARAVKDVNSNRGVSMIAPSTNNAAVCFSSIFYHPTIIYDDNNNDVIYILS